MSRLLILALFLCALGSGRACAHGDHEEGGPPPLPDVGTRIESSGATMELVATSNGHRLIIYLDRSETSDPVDDAAIEVSGDDFPAVAAKQVGPGTYELEAEWVDQPGTKALVFSVTTKSDADLLAGTWTVAEAAVVPDSRAEPQALGQVVRRPAVLALVGGALVLGFLLALALRLKSRRELPSGEARDALDPKGSGSVAFRSAAEVVLLAVVLGGLTTVQVLAGPGHDHDDGEISHRKTSASNAIAPRKLPDGTVYVPKPSQRLLGLRTLPAAASNSAPVRELIGTVVPDPSSFGLVQAPMDGLVEVSERGISYAGQKVEAGEVLALLTPSIPVADLGTMQQLRAEVAGKLVVAEQKLDRLTRIADVVAKSQIDDTRAEIAALREQARVLEPKDTQKIALKAPVTGIISVANVRAGQVVTARDTLFEIVDPQRLWIEAIGDAAHGEAAMSSATAVDNEGHALKLSYIGRSPTLRQQAQPILFRIDNAHPEIVIGSAVSVLVRSQGAVEGFELPAAAIVRGGNGLSQVWVKVSPEHFRPAEVKVEPLDGERVLIAAGIKPGDRVVTVAAELINQIR